MDVDKGSGPLHAGSADPTGPGIELAGADSALELTLATRMHCRRPMQVVEDSGLSPSRLPADTVTYRCCCGFTMDVPGPLAATA
ncbi:hypothetical protein [Arthrobacter mobilis]|uniref:Uncharacterized protein n=1 Tax=Arthrobacter mobilis TaxID=2724944 RepID=A0A7X6HBH4_9MICC|nr:hypothetical protein [Arthrobacter mobilis]NKX54034.1 hypothetical protein [Arthrobacter mobilis]